MISDFRIALRRILAFFNPRSFLRKEKFTTLPDDALLLISDNLIQKNLEAYKELAK